MVQAGRVGGMLQTGSLVEHLRVRELLCMVASRYPHPRPVDEVLGLTGTADLAGRGTTKLSGGQTHRVALVGDPDLLVLDEPTAAAVEVAEVEALGRAALADVRAAVSRYREPTVAGELATGRELLRAAGIAAVLPASADGVPAEGRDLFAWVVREGLTNVVRHSCAATCTVTLRPESLEIVADGTGSTRRAGTPGGGGLVGLRERVEAAGATMQADPAPGGGWRLHVTLATGDRAGHPPRLVGRAGGGVAGGVAEPSRRWPSACCSPRTRS